jgi:F-type H+-transporting ATPase subunit gamma
MSEAVEVLQRKIWSARELGSVVRMMKVLAAVSIIQYERAMHSLSDYYHAVELGLSLCVQGIDSTHTKVSRLASSAKVTTTAIAFGSDQGLVGQFNDTLADFVITKLNELPGEKTIWAIGERIYARLEDAGGQQNRLYDVPNSVTAIAPLVSQILIDHEDRPKKGETYLFYNRPVPRAGYEPVKQRLLPLDTEWQRKFRDIEWPTKILPEVLGSRGSTLGALIREYLFVSLFKACAESLASENASRLAAMQRAQRNIDELLDELRTAYNQERQTSIDEELFDVVAGFEVLANKHRTQCSHRAGRSRYHRQQVVRSAGAPYCHRGGSAPYRGAAS